MHHHPPAGYVHRIRITLFLSGDRCHFDIQVLFVSIKKEWFHLMRILLSFVMVCYILKGLYFVPALIMKTTMIPITQ